MPALPSPFIAAAPSLPVALPIQRLEIVSFDGHFFARVCSGEFHGVVALNHWTPALVSLWQSLILPFWVGRDARDLVADCETLASLNLNYKLAGAPFWIAFAGIELAIWDLLGQVSGQSVAALICKKPRRKVPVYLSSLRRENDAKAEIERLSESVARTGAKAVKIKIGGRGYWDAQTDARDRELLKLARAQWGEKFGIYADANGSFEAAKAIEVGEMLHEYRVAWFGEPCDWEDFEATRTVAASVQLPVAGGEQDSSWPKWKWLLENCALDIAQPDLNTNGGLSRSLRVAQFAANLGVSTAPHSPDCAMRALPALHFAAVLEKPAPFLEWDADSATAPSWFESALEIRNGAVTLPKGAGWGASYDEEIWKSAQTLAMSSV